MPGTGGEREPSAVVGNPYSLRTAFSKLDVALNEIISALEGEEEAVGSSSSQETLIAKFKSWRMELANMRGGVNRFGGHVQSHAPGTVQEGGLFSD